MNRFKTKLKSVLNLARDVWHFDFAFIGSSIDFKAGQYFMLEVPESDEKRISRAYSIESSPLQKDFFSLCIKLVEGGKASGYFKNLQVDNEVSFVGPYGHFLLQESDKNIIFVATGTGIAPFMSMMDVLWSKGFDRSVSLYFGVSSEEDLFYMNELRKWESEHENLKLFVTLSHPSDKWEGLKGRVTAHLETADVENSKIYLCGNGEMIKDVRDLMLAKGVAKDDIHFEAFTPLAPLK